MGVIIMPLAFLMYAFIPYTVWNFYSAHPSLILPTIIGTVVLTALILWSKPANAD